MQTYHRRPKVDIRGTKAWIIRGQEEPGYSASDRCFDVEPGSNPTCPDCGNRLTDADPLSLPGDLSCEECLSQFEVLKFFLVVALGLSRDHVKCILPNQYSTELFHADVSAPRGVNTATWVVAMNDSAAGVEKKLQLDHLGKEHLVIELQPGVDRAGLIFTPTCHLLNKMGCPIAR